MKEQEIKEKEMKEKETNLKTKEMKKKEIKEKKMKEQESKVLNDLILEFFSKHNIKIYYRRGSGVITTSQSKIYFDLKYTREDLTQSDYLVAAWLILRPSFNYRGGEKITKCLTNSKQEIHDECNITAVHLLKFYDKINKNNFFEGTTGKWCNYLQGANLLQHYLVNHRGKKYFSFEDKEFECLFISSTSYYFLIKGTDKIIRISDHWTEPKKNVPIFSQDQLRNWYLENVQYTSKLDMAFEGKEFLSGITSFKQLRRETFFANVI